MDGQELLNGLQLKDRSLFNQQVQLVATVNKNIAVANRLWLLPLDREISSSQLIAEAGLIS